MPKFYTARDLAKKKGVTRTAVYIAVREHSIRSVPTGTRERVFDEEALRIFLQRRPGRPRKNGEGRS